MQLNLCIATCVISTLYFIQGTNAIKCYQCKSLTDSNCGKSMIDATSNIRQVDCDVVAKPNSMEEFMPVTKCNKVVTSDRAGVIISRDCHFQVVGQKDNVCSVSHSRQVDECYTCTGDLCNASAANTLITWSIFVLTALFLMHLVI